MKNLLTFIYGLLLIALGVGLIIYQKDHESFLYYIWCIVGGANILLGISKLNESTL